VGDFNGDGKVDLALITRAGELFVWKTDGAACGTREWPKYQHDLANTGNYATDAEPPAVVGDLRLARGVLMWRAPGDDGNCGTAKRYIVKVNGQPVTSGVPTPGAAGSSQTMNITTTHVRTVTVQAQDDAGNLGIPATVSTKRTTTTGATATSKQSGNLTTPANSAGAKPTSSMPGVLGGLSLLILMVGLSIRRRARAH
jgi:hypothetical protein